MVYRRLLTSLASASSSSSNSSASRLLPPYSYAAKTATATEIPRSFKPPYAHQVPSRESETRGGRSLRSSLRYTIPPPSTAVGTSTSGQAGVSWAQEILSTSGGRERILVKWNEVLSSLNAWSNQEGQGQVEIDQIPLHSLSNHLSSESNVQRIKSTGMIIVRDVIPDNEAIEIARQVLRAINERNGRPVFWHKALLDARANPSVLSANQQVMRALTGSEENYVQADSIYEGLGESISTAGLGSGNGRSVDIDNLWAIGKNAHTPLLSHLTLTPSLPSIPPFITITPTMNAALYSILRPLFRPIRSRISFYTTDEYLNEANWTLRDPSDLEAPIQVDLPHLQGTGKGRQVSLPSLNPGDLVLRNESLPVHCAPGSGQVFLPLSPIPKQADGTTGNDQWVNEQKEKFENGLPPTSAKFTGNDEFVLVEQRGKKEDISSRAGRRAMGYE